MIGSEILGGYLLVRRSSHDDAVRHVILPVVAVVDMVSRRRMADSKRAHHGGNALFGYRRRRDLPHGVVRREECYGESVGPLLHVIDRIAGSGVPLAFLVGIDPQILKPVVRVEEQVA